MGKRTKYSTRSDGRKYTKRVYTDFGPTRYSGTKFFYGKTVKEVDDKIKLFEESLLFAKSSSNVSVSHLAAEWFNAKKETLSLNSVPSYNTKVNEIKNYFGDTRVDEVTVQDIHKWLDTKRIQQYSQRAISDRRSILKQIFDYAVLYYGLDHNPCNDLPTIKGKSAVPRQPASETDLERIEAHKTDSMMARLYYFLVYTGARIGEAVTLQEKDIDRSNRRALICKDIAWKNNVPIVKNKPKTKAGERYIDLYQNVLDILPQYDNPETYIFFPGGLPHASAFQKAKRKYQNSIGITATPHQLRHSYAGILHSAGVSAKDAQARLGHASIAMTEDIYTQIERTHTAKISANIDRYIQEERLNKKPTRCVHCGSTYTVAADGHIFTFCPDCGQKIE